MAPGETSDSRTPLDVGIDASDCCPGEERDIGPQPDIGTDATAPDASADAAADG